MNHRLDGLTTPSSQPSGLTKRLSTKLRPPVESPSEVARSALCERILSVGRAQLVLICAAAGFGKTTLMRQLLRRCEQAGMRSAWLTLDNADNDVGRFLAGLNGALESVLPKREGRDEVNARVDSGGLALRLIDWLERVEEPFVLFLDDFEVLHSSSVLSLVQQVLSSLPGGAQIVVGSRVVPELGLGRLRAQGLLLEVHPAQLRFSREEADAFLQERRGLTLEAPQIEQLYQRTAGWPAALWLAALALERRGEVGEFIARFSGTHDSVAGYLGEEVIARQPPGVRDFLLKTSILRDLTASACDAVCDRQDSQDVLARLERENLFLLPTDDTRTAFRYHALFAEFLRAQLQKLYPEEVQALHLRASRWYIARGRPVPAIEHALQSKDLDYALPLLSKYAGRLLDDTRMRLLARWLGTVPPEALSPLPQLRIIHVWVVNFTRGPRPAMELLDDIGSPDALDPESASLLLALRPMLLHLMDEDEEAYDLGAKNIAKLAEGANFARSMLSITMAEIAIKAGKFSDARQYIDSARRAQALSSGGFGFALSEALDGELDLIRGHLRQARVRLQAAVEPKERDPTRHSRINAMAGVLLAEALYESDDWEQAGRFLDVYVPLMDAGGLPDQIITGYVLLARIQAIKGDYERAVQLITDLEFRGHRAEVRRIVLSARVERARLALAQGKSELAAEELDAAEDNEIWGRASRWRMIANDVETLQIGRLRWLIRSGRSEAALPDLLRLIDESKRQQRERRSLKLRILAAEALHSTGEIRSARRLLGKALEQAEPEGFVRTFADEGAVVAKMLREFWQGSSEGEGVAPPSEFRHKLLRAIGAREVVVADIAADAPVKLEPLTRKEIQVLEMVALGHSNRALADKLCVSETTVRTHLRSINVKLGVHSRVHALAVARRAGLIS